MAASAQLLEKNAVVAELRSVLLDIAPIHDTPIGVIHPYWARKPMNVIETVINHLTLPGDLVVDPFMGSGTTVFGALQNGRRVVGSDISILSQHLVSGLIDLIENSELILPEIRRLLDEHRKITLPWYAFDDDNYVERLRFQVTGEFTDGAFCLEPTEIVTKVPKGLSWIGRRAHSDVLSLGRLPRVADNLGHMVAHPVDFESLTLPENSRIAIPRGATLAQYFTEENRASINVLVELIQKSPLSADHSAALKLVLSASLPSLRLSDKKASSQWPYWRPKTDLTSRNPIIVLEARYKQVVQLVDWSQSTALPSDFGQRHQILAVAAQLLTSESYEGQARLVLTDPPYGDQVPYLEYSAMWNGVLGLNVHDKVSSQELVRSNASHRRSDSSDYLERLKSAFAANASLLETGGFLAWFYQDQDLRCWEAIHDAAIEAGMVLLDVIPIPKQRRSLKTVTSPNATLDGDLLCVFTTASGPSDTFRSREPQILDDGNESDGNHGSYFDRYAVLILSALRSGNISKLADQYGTVKRALAAMGNSFVLAFG
ncbi:protein involved in DNA alkylation [Arthrobacter sp. Hiyo4]|nr:protein involved in DNA alkylation [Arthrobacter sp. Hiyo4]